MDYTCLDMIFISLGDLRTLVRQHPERWQAIRQWLLTGPTLVVYDMPLDSPRLAELDELLRLPASPLRSSPGPPRPPGTSPPHGLPTRRSAACSRAVNRSSWASRSLPGSRCLRPRSSRRFCCGPPAWAAWWPCRRPAVAAGRRARNQLAVQRGGQPELGLVSAARIVVVPGEPRLLEHDDSRRGPGAGDVVPDLDLAVRAGHRPGELLPVEARSGGCTCCW